MSLFLVPVIIYGAMLLGQKFPKSEAESAGVTLGQMIGTVFAPLMLVLLVAQAMVGYVELGTDSWISKITGSIMASPAAGLKLFVYTSLLMFALRFVAGPIVHRISPLGLLFVSSILGFIGLTLLGGATTVTACVIAATVYACGKTFLWPTMLAVVSERFPKGGAVAIGMVGGVGMLSAGLLGGPAIGFKQDYNASSNLQQVSKETYDRYKADDENSFLGYKTVGLNGSKVAILDDNGKELVRAGELLAKEGKKDENHAKLAAWWETAKASAEKDKKPVSEAGIHGGKTALKLTAYVPAMMAVIFLLLIFFFKAQGGYKALNVEDALTVLANPIHKRGTVHAVPRFVYWRDGVPMWGDLENRIAFAAVRTFAQGSALTMRWRLVASAPLENPFPFYHERHRNQPAGRTETIHH
jgi:hypothetical protein